MHTSPLMQPGIGDSGGMNVYVRELSSRLARSGLECEVFTRAYSDSLPATVSVEPGLRVHHVPAGPLGPVGKHELDGLVDELTEGVLTLIDVGVRNGTLMPPDVVHANYWLSGLVGHAMKHELGVPLVTTFHTLAKVKEMSRGLRAVRRPLSAGKRPGGTRHGPDVFARAQAEDLVAACSDAVLASCDVEAEQLVSLCEVDPSRVVVIPPGVDHAFFSPGYRPQARRAVGLGFDGPLIMFAGRIEPMKGADIAVRSLALLDGHPSARLAIVGGPSGPEGEAELSRVRALVSALRIEDRVAFVPPQPHELLSTYYRAADVCVVPSHTESFGLVALEASACGTPVVATAVGGLQTLVEDGASGFLVDAFNVGAGARRPGAQGQAVDDRRCGPHQAAEGSGYGATGSGTGSGPRLRMRSSEAIAADIATRVSTLLSDPLLAAQMAGNASMRAKSFSWSTAAARLRAACSSLASERLVECS